MRSIIYAVVLGSFTVAAAQPSAGPDPSQVPDKCKDVASVPADAKSATPGNWAKISAATCGATSRFSALKLAPDDASMKAMTDAAQPSFDLLDSVIKGGDSAFAAVATKAKADLYLSMAVRMRNSIPPITMTTVGAPLQEHDQAHAALEPKIKPWLDQAQAK